MLIMGNDRSLRRSLTALHHAISSGVCVCLFLLRFLLGGKVIVVVTVAMATAVTAGKQEEETQF